MPIRMSTVPSAVSCDDLARLLVAEEARDHLDARRQAGEALLEGVVVLLRQDGGRHEDGDLVAVHHGLEGGAHGHLRLAEAHVAADQAVHRARRLHVGLHGVDRGDLVGRLDITEGGFELLLPRRVGCEGVAVQHLARRVQVEQVARHVRDGLAHAVARAGPLAGAEACEVGVVVAGSDVARHAVRLLDGHEQPVALGVRELQELLLHALDVAHDHAREAPDAVLEVDDVVARRQVGDQVRAVGRGLSQRPPLLHEAEDLGVGQQQHGGEDPSPCPLPVDGEGGHP